VCDYADEGYTHAASTPVCLVLYTLHFIGQCKLLLGNKLSPLSGLVPRYRAGCVNCFFFLQNTDPDYALFGIIVLASVATIFITVLESLTSSSFCKLLNALDAERVHCHLML